MATTDLKLEEPGSLPKPGPIGRFVRFAFGVLSIYYVIGLWSVRDDLILGDGSIRTLVWNGVVPALFLISYVRDVRGEVSAYAILALYHPVLVVAVVGRAKPDGAVFLVQLAGCPQRRQCPVDRI